VTPTDTDRPETDKERVLVALLLRIWDPIGVQPGVHAPANEYDSYVQGVLSIIHSDGDAAALAAFLENVRTVRMGLGASTRRDQAMAIAILAAVELLAPPSPSPGPAPASSDPLPTARQRELLGDMIHAAFVEVRVLGQAGHAEQAADLADAFHNISKVRWSTPDPAETPDTPPRAAAGQGSLTWEIRAVTAFAAPMSRCDEAVRFFLGVGASAA